MYHNIKTIKDIVSTIGPDCFDTDAMGGKNSNGVITKTYGEFGDEVRSLANGLLHQKVTKGDIVGICMSNRIEWPVIFFSVCSIGAVALPVDSLLTDDELLYVIDESDITTLFISSGESERIALIQKKCSRKITIISVHNNNEGESFGDILTYRDVMNIGKDLVLNGKDLFAQGVVDPEDAACMVHMHGNTFVVLSHKGLVENAKGMIQIFSEDYLQKGERWLSVLPFHHVYPVVNSLLIPFIKRNTVMMINTLRVSELISVINDYKIQYMTLVPLLLGHLYDELVRKKLTLRPVRFIISGGAPLHEKVIHGMSDIGVMVLQGYGLSENSPIVASNRPEDNRAGSIGRKLHNMEVKIDNPDSDGNGELLVKGPCTMIGYYKKEKETSAALSEDGWLRTGDIARIDKDGYIFITGRRKNVIVNKGGINIYPENIEKVLIRSSYIADVVVVPKINEIQGEYPHAIIVPDYEAIVSKEGCSDISDEDLLKLIKKAAAEAVQTIASYNKLKGFDIVDKDEMSNYKNRDLFLFYDYYLESRPPVTITDGEVKTGKITVSEDNLPDIVYKDLEAIVSYYLKIGKNDIDGSADLSDYGFDSISLTGCIGEINERYSIDITPSIIFDLTSLQEISAYLSKTYKEKIITVLGNDQAEPLSFNEQADQDTSLHSDSPVAVPVTRIRDRELAQYFMGVDAGSTTIKIAILDQDGEIYHTSYKRSSPTQGSKLNCSGNCERCGKCSKGSLKKNIATVLDETDLTMDHISHIVVTGSQINAEVRNVIPYDAFISEVTAHIAGALHFHDDCKAILDVGGQDSKSMRYDESIGGWKSKMSGICAAGTGAFLDNVAGKLGITVESMEEIADYNSPLDFSSVCAVFAATSINKFKSRYSLPELVGGACAAQARTIMSGVGELLKNYQGKILFQGGVASNKVVAHFLQEITGNEIVVPSYYQVMGAIGAALLAREQKEMFSRNKYRIFNGISDKEYKAVTLRSRTSIKDFFAIKDKPVVWRNLFYPVEILNAMGCQVYTLETRAALAAQNRKDIKKYLDKATLKGYGAETCSFLRVLEGMDLPEPIAGVSTTQPCQQGERILRDLLVSSGKKDSFHALQSPIDESPEKINALARDIEESIYMLERAVDKKMDMKKLEEAFEYSNQAREYAVKCNDLRATSVPLIPGRIAINFTNLLTQGWGTREFVEVQAQLYQDLLKRKDELEGKADINDFHRLGWLHLSPYYSTELMDFVERDCNAPVVYEEANAVRWSPLDISDPYMSLARKVIDAGFMSMEKRINYIVDELKRSRANGCILYNHMFSRCSMADITVIRNLQDALGAIGIPLLVLDGDCIDPTIDPCSTFTKVQAYTEVLNLKKYNNYFGIWVDDIDDSIRDEDLCCSC